MGTHDWKNIGGFVNCAIDDEVSRGGRLSPRERSVDASEVHDSHHRLRFVMFTYNASYDPLAGAPSMLAFFLDSCLERINSATPGFILLELLSAFA